MTDPDEAEAEELVRDIYRAGGHVRHERTYQRGRKDVPLIPDDRFWPIGEKGEYTPGVGYPESGVIDDLENRGLIKPGHWRQTPTGESRDYQLTPKGKRWADIGD